MVEIVVKYHIDFRCYEFVEELYEAFVSENYEDIQLMIEAFNAFWDKWDHKVKCQVKNLLENYMRDGGIDPEEDLKGCLNKVLEYNTLTPKNSNT